MSDNCYICEEPIDGEVNAMRIGFLRYDTCMKCCESGHSPYKNDAITYPMVLHKKIYQLTKTIDALEKRLASLESDRDHDETYRMEQNERN